MLYIVVIILIKIEFLQQRTESGSWNPWLLTGWGFNGVLAASHESRIPWQFEARRFKRWWKIDGNWWNLWEIYGTLMDIDGKLMGNWWNFIDNWRKRMEMERWWGSHQMLTTWTLTTFFGPFWWSFSVWPWKARLPAAALRCHSFNRGEEIPKMEIWKKIWSGFGLP